MKAMLLAAGYGKRLLPLTQSVPKPLIVINGKTIIAHLIEQLAEQGFTELVINVSYRAAQIKAALGCGKQFGVTIQYSEEAEPLETGGGIFNALPLLGESPFLVLNSDIMTDYPFAELKTPFEGLANLVLIDKKVDGSAGDFALQAGHVKQEGTELHTFSGIAVYEPALFKACTPGAYSVVPLLKQAMADKQVMGQLYKGEWQDIGNIARLVAMQK